MRVRIAMMAIGLSAAFLGGSPVSAQTTIDDFQTGTYEASIRSADVLAVRAGSMLGGYRWTHLIAGDGTANPFAQAGAVQIRDGALVVSGGYKVYPRLEVFYGLGPEGVVPLNLNLAALGDRLRLHFQGSDRGLNVNIVLFSDAAYAQVGYNLDASDAPFTQDFALQDFGAVAGFDLTHVNYIALVVQSGSAIGSNDWALTKFDVVGDPLQ